MSSQHPAIDRPVHITCQHCKHFHKNWEYSLPPSGGRVKCARCKTDMFALGRAETQVTLASVDSIPLSQLGTSAASVPAGRSDLPQSRSDISAQLPSAPIAHQSQPSLEGQQVTDSVGNQPQGTGSQSQEIESDTSTDSDGVRKPSQLVSSIYVRLLQKVPYLESFFGASDYVNTLGTRLATGLPQTRREYSIFGWLFIIRPPDDRGATGHASAAMNMVQQPDTPSFGHAQAYSPAPAEPLEPTNSDVLSRTPPITPAVHLGSVEQPSDGATVPAAEGPSDRLIQYRRHKTLVKNALHRFNCRCRGDCHCILRNVEPSTSDFDIGDAHSSRVRTPPPLDEIPNNPVIDRLGAQQFLFFSHMGHSTERSDHSLDTSQASTLGSGASVMLRPGRPRFIIRSRSMPGH